MRKIYRFLLKLKFWQYVLLFFGVFTAVNIAFSPLVDTTKLEEIFAKFPAVVVVLLSVVVAPIWETAIFQTLPLKYGYRLLKDKWGFRRCAWPLIVLSAVVFGINHSYSTSYIVAGVLMGLVFGFAYHVARKRKQSATLTVMLIHASANLIGTAGEIAERLMG